MADALDGRLRLVDLGAAESAFRSIKVENSFNLTAEQAKSIGTVIGCDFFLIVRSATQRRTSSARPNYYEAHAAYYLVNSRTGFLDLWHLETKSGDTVAEAEKLLNNSVADIADTFATKVRNAKIVMEQEPTFEAFDPDSKAMRPAMPFKRVKPEYTPTAYLYGIAATVDAEVSIDVNGDVKRIDITRWAGYGLDESVIAAIRQMNWRPGERGGKPLPMRVLLRYNFTKI